MSDVLVKGMDMPTACRSGKCNFACSAAYQTGLICVVRKQYVVPGDVPVDCPCSLVPPHGDLIDRDALHQELYALEYARENEWLDGIREARGVDAARVALLDAPTIIEGDEHT